MFETLNKALAAGKSLGLSTEEFQQVGPTRWKDVLDDILVATTERGLRNRNRYWLWEDFVDPHYSLPPSLTMDLMDLRCLGDPASRVYLLLEDWNDTKKVGYHWVLEGTLESALSVLAEMHLLEFYLVARDMSWIVAENHHGYWIGAGPHAVGVLHSIEAIY